MFTMAYVCQIFSITGPDTPICMSLPNCHLPVGRASYESDTIGSTLHTTRQIICKRVTIHQIKQGLHTRASAIKQHPIFSVHE